MPAPLEVLGELVVGIDHVGLAVSDLDESISTWVETFGGKLHSREVNEDQGVEEAMLKFSNGSQIQLLAALSSDSTIGKFLTKHGQGMQQLALHVTDLAEATQRLADVGIYTVYPSQKVGSNGTSINFLHPKYTGGVLIELVEYVT